MNRLLKEMRLLWDVMFFLKWMSVKNGLVADALSGGENGLTAFTSFFKN